MNKSNLPADLISTLIPVDFDPFVGGELLLTVPTTEAQREIWLFAKMGEEANCAFNESVWLRLCGSLNVEALRSSFQKLIARHEALRTTFSPDGAILCIAASLIIEIPLIDLSHLDEQSQEVRWEKIRRQAVETPFDLEHGPLLRVQIVKRQAQEHWVVITLHHIIVDSWSLGILLRELGILYSAFCRGVSLQLPEPDHFSEYALWQQQQATEPEYIAAEEYWLRQFPDNIPVLELPIDRPRPHLRTFKAAREDTEVDPSLVIALKSMGAKFGCTFVTTVLAGFEVFLHRITGQEDLVVGIAAAGQVASGKPNLVGYCVNLLPSRTHVDGQLSFSEYLQSRRATLLNDYEHQQVTFGSLLKKLAVPQDPSRIPLVSVRFNIDRILEHQLPSLEGMELELFSNPRAFENFEIFLDAWEVGNRFFLQCHYNTDLFESQTIRDHLEEFEILLAGIVAAPELAMVVLQKLLEDKRSVSIRSGYAATARI